MGHIECDWSGTNNVKGAEYDERWCQMDGTMSSAHMTQNEAGDPKVDQEAMGHVEHDWSGANDIEGAGYNGR